MWSVILFTVCAGGDQSHDLWIWGEHVNYCATSTHSISVHTKVGKVINKPITADLHWCRFCAILILCLTNLASKKVNSDFNGYATLPIWLSQVK